MCPEDRDSGFGVTTQELTLVALLEEPGVMTLDSWHHIGGVILRTTAAFFCVLRVVQKMLWEFGCYSKNINRSHLRPGAISILCAWNI